MLHQEEKVKRSMLKKKNICIFKKDFPLIKTNIDIYWKSNKRGTLLKKSLWHRCFAVNFAKFLRTPFLQNTGGCFLRYSYVRTETIAEVV